MYRQRNHDEHTSHTQSVILREVVNNKTTQNNNKKKQKNTTVHFVPSAQS
jgi:hypothetical protein